MKKHLFAIVFSAALVVFSAYFALDTFVISKSYGSAVEINTTMFAEASADASSEQCTSSAGQAEEQAAQQGDHYRKAARSDITAAMAVEEGQT